MTDDQKIGIEHRVEYLVGSNEKVAAALNEFDKDGWTIVSLSYTGNEGWDWIVLLRKYSFPGDSD